MSFIEETQGVFAGLIAKPKMSEKLLNKPPFRFLHDIVSNITKATGYAAGLYEGDELNAKAIKDKSAKVAYLEKIIGFVTDNGATLEVRPSKIVAGLEPEHTNAFLVAFAHQAIAFRDGGDSGGKTADEEPEGKHAADNDAAAADAAAAEAAAAEAEAAAQAQAAAEAQAAAQAQAAAEAAAAEAAAAEANAKARDDGPSEGKHAGAGVEEADGQIETTQRLVEPIISRPKMSSKLLGKPPFRFLHDVFMGISNATGFGAGLYEGDELIAKAIKEKTAKVDFLEKAINVVGIALGAHVPARPSKIVAGLEPENTNVFLQMLAIAATNVGDSSGAVAAVLSGEVQPEEGATPAAGPEDDGGAAEAAAAEAERARREAAAEEQRRAEEQRQAEAKRAAAEAARAAEAAQAAAQQAAADEPHHSEGKGDDAGAGAGPMGGMASGPVTAGPIAGMGDLGGDGSTAMGAGAGTEVSGGGGVRRLARPQTARRRPPKIREHAKEVTDSKTNVEGTATGIMGEGDASDSESDGEAAEVERKRRELTQAAGTEAAPVGKHTRDIIGEERKDEGARGGQSETQAAGSTGIIMGRIKKTGDKSAFSQMQVEKLRTAIQKLCQSTNPLGKCMDYVHEDMDVMKNELAQWKNEYRRRVEALERERAKTEEALQPLQHDLDEADKNLADQQAKINAVKAGIARNDIRIQELLRMVVAT